MESILPLLLGQQQHGLDRTVSIANQQLQQPTMADQFLDRLRQGQQMKLQQDQQDALYGYRQQQMEQKLQQLLQAREIAEAKQQGAEDKLDWLKNAANPQNMLALGRLNEIKELLQPRKESLEKKNELTGLQADKLEIQNKTEDELRKSVIERNKRKPLPRIGAGVNGMPLPKVFDPSQEMSPEWESAARQVKQTGKLQPISSRNPMAPYVNARGEWLAANPNDGSTPKTLGGTSQSFATRANAMKYWTTGQGAAAFRQQETIKGHADAMIRAVDALDNGNVTVANKILNNYRRQIGDNRSTNMELIGKVLSAEVGKYLSGGIGTGEERKEFASLMPMFNSPGQLHGALDALKDLIDSQRRSWEIQRDAALEGEVPFGGSGSGSKGKSTIAPSGDADVDAALRVLGH